MQVGGGIWIIWAEYLVVKILILFIMKRHSQSSGYFWQLNKENFPLIWFVQKRIFVEVKTPKFLSPERCSFYIKKKLGYGHFQSANTGWDLQEATKQQQTLIYSQITVRGRTDRGWNRINARAIFILTRCHGVTIGHVTIIVTPRKLWHLTRIYAPESRSPSAPAAGRVNVQIGIYISSSSGKSDSVLLLAETRPLYSLICRNCQMWSSQDLQTPHNGIWSGRGRVTLSRLISGRGTLR